MVIGPILVFAALAMLLIGTFTDFKIREVPDWVNYSGIFIGLGLRLIYSTATFDWSYFLAGAMGFGVFYALALVMFYLGQWGGGDAKMLMALGALLGLEFRVDSPFASFLVNMLIIGAAYGILWSLIMAVKNRKAFVREASRIVRTRRFHVSKIAFISSAFALAIAAFFIKDYFLRIGLLIIAMGLVVMFYAWFFVKAIEECCMVKPIPVEKLTEGDWIVKDVVINRKRICGPKDLGISKEQINALLKYKRKGKISKILIKEGMPFVPSFLIAYIVTLIWGNIVLMLI